MLAMGVFVSVVTLLVIAGGLVFAAFHFAFYLNYFDWIQNSLVSQAVSNMLLVFDAVLFAVAALVGFFGSGMCILRKQALFFHWVQKGDRVHAPDMSTRITFEKSRFISWWDPVFKNGGMLARHQKLRIF